MSEHGKMLLVRILTGSDAKRTELLRKALNYGVSETVMKASGDDKYFNDIIKHFEKYGKVMAFETFIKKHKVFKDIKATEPLEFYLDGIKENYMHARLAGVKGELDKKLTGGKPEEALNYLLSELNSLTSFKPKDSVLDMRVSVDERISQYKARRASGIIDGIPSGWEWLDELLGGWHGSDFITLTGRMESFKTWFLLDWIKTAWMNGFKILLFTREMAPAMVARRVDCLVTETKFHDVRRGKLTTAEQGEFFKKLDEMSEFSPFNIVGGFGQQEYNLAYINSKIIEYKPDIVFIDGMYLIQATGTSEWAQMTNVSRGLKQLATRFNIPVVGTTQTNRQQRKSGPTIDNLGYTDAWGQDSDVVIGIARLKDDEGEPTNESLLKTLKVREEMHGKAVMSIDWDKMRVVHQTEADAEEVEFAMTDESDETTNIPF